MTLRQPDAGVRPPVTEFFQGLAAALDGVQVSDRDGAMLTLTAGLEQAIDLVVRQTRAGRKIMFIGNGASAAISSHQSVDFWRTGGMRAVAFNDGALLTCIGNDFGYSAVFEKPIEMFADHGDVLSAISSSGQSENILRGVCKARERHCLVLTMSGFEPENPLRRLGDINFYVASRSYAHVEIAHLSISHCILDTIRKVYGSPPRASGT